MNEKMLFVQMKIGNISGEKKGWGGVQRRNRGIYPPKGNEARVEF